jgi:hypothetical protein
MLLLLMMMQRRGGGGFHWSLALRLWGGCHVAVMMRGAHPLGLLLMQQGV